MAKHDSFKGEFARATGIPTRVVGALIRHFDPYSARFLIYAIEVTSDDILKAIPGIGRLAFKHVRARFPYAPRGTRSRWGEDAPFGDRLEQARYWESKARLERRRANILDRAFRMVAPACRVDADVYVSRAERFTEAG